MTPEALLRLLATCFHPHPRTGELHWSYVSGISLPAIIGPLAEAAFAEYLTPDKRDAFENPQGGKV